MNEGGSKKGVPNLHAATQTSIRGTGERDAQHIGDGILILSQTSARCNLDSARTSTVLSYRVDGVDVAEETERNEAAARQSWGRQHTWLLLSFSPFPVRHPLHPLCTLNLNRRRRSVSIRANK